MPDLNSSLHLLKLNYQIDMTYKNVLLSVLMVLLSTSLSWAQSDIRYTVKPGDTLYSISRQFDIGVDDLRKLNNLESGNIRAGMIIVVGKAAIEPTASEVIAPARTDADLPGKADVDLPVNSGLLEGEDGETVESVALQLGLTQEELRFLNPDIDSAIKRLNAADFSTEKVTKTYVVKVGDTLFGIARAHGLSAKELTELNKLKDTGVKIGQKLQIPGEQPAGLNSWKSNGISDAMMYPSTLTGRTLGGGLPYNSSTFVIGHHNLPVGSLVMLGRAQEGPSILCIVADQSLSLSNDLLDVSAAIAESLGVLENEKIEVFTLK